MKRLTSELIGPPLDWAVAVAEGRNPIVCGTHLKSIWSNDERDSESEELCYSTNWAQGGPIIEREYIGTEQRHSGKRTWRARIDHANTRYECFGPTPLIAAMRCFVASKLGDEVDVPAELA